MFRFVLGLVAFCSLGTAATAAADPFVSWTGWLDPEGRHEALTVVEGTLAALAVAEGDPGAIEGLLAHQASALSALGGVDVPWVEDPEPLTGPDASPCDVAAEHMNAGYHLLLVQHEAAAYAERGGADGGLVDARLATERALHTAVSATDSDTARMTIEAESRATVEHLREFLVLQVPSSYGAYRVGQLAHGHLKAALAQFLACEDLGAP